MGTLADILLPLCGTIGNDEALEIRKACDGLESTAQGTTRRLNHALDLISSLTKRIEALERARVDVRERLMEMDQERDSLEGRIEALERANKNTGERGTDAPDVIKTDEVRTQASSPACSLCHGMLSEDECRRVNTGEDTSTRKGDGAADLSVSTSSPAPPCSAQYMQEWLQAINEQHERKFGKRANENTAKLHGDRSEVPSSAENVALGACPQGSGRSPEGVSSPRDGSASACRDADEQHTASPAPEIPSWVPSDTDLHNAFWDPKLRGMAGRWGLVRRLIAERAPRASTVSVEEMADVLLKTYAGIEGTACLCNDMRRKVLDQLARAALSAMPASPEIDTSAIEESIGEIVESALNTLHVSPDYRGGIASEVRAYLRDHFSKLKVQRLSALPAPDEKPLTPAQRVKPCGCVVCVCPGDERCYGCGARSCDEHNPSVQRKRLEEHLAAPDAPKPAPCCLCSMFSKDADCRCECHTPIDPRTPKPWKWAPDVSVKDREILGDAPKPASKPTTYYVGDFSTFGDAKPNIVKLVEEKPASEAQGEPTRVDRAVRDLQAAWEAFAYSEDGSADERRAIGEFCGVFGCTWKTLKEALASRAPVVAQGEPPTFDECCEAFDRECDDNESLREIRDGIAAVRDLCLASRAPSPSPALAAIVEAGDAMAKHLWHADWCREQSDDVCSCGFNQAVSAYKKARAALPKGGDA